MSGDEAIVGATENSATGAAYVFQRDQGGNDNWGEVRKLTASDADASDSFGSSVAISDDVVVVGAFQEDTGGPSAGAAYIFQRDQGGTNNWGEVKKLTASDATLGGWFGLDVAVSADTVVVGAIGDAAGGTDAGAAYIFQRDQGGTNNWGEVKKLTASNAGAFDYFGVVAVSGDNAVVGAPYEDTGGTNTGAVYVFRRDQGGMNNWGQVKKLSASDAQADDRFGWSVGLSGTTAVLGAAYEDAGGANAGAAYVFQRDQGGTNNWGEEAKLTAADAQAGNQFGSGVAVSGDTAAVGAAYEDAGGTDAGAAYVFEPAVAVGGLARVPEMADARPAEDKSAGTSSVFSLLVIAATTAVLGLGAAWSFARGRVDDSR
jgi:hypothetical protein